MEILAIIPARGGSKKIPGKNIKPLLGKPLIGYAIEEAHKSEHITRTIVTTDDEEIASVARDFGAQVPFMRPRELALDHVTDLPVFQHALRWLADQEDYHPDMVVHLRPTAPLRRVAHIDAGISLLLASPEVDTVRSVTGTDAHPLKMWAIEDGMLTPFIPTDVYGIKEAYNQPRQQLPDAYIQNGSVDVIRPHIILEHDSMTGQRIKAFVMDEMDSVNVDGPLDWALAEILMQQRQDAAG